MNILQKSYTTSVINEEAPTKKISPLAVFCALSCNSAKMIEYLLKEKAFDPTGSFTSSEIIGGYGIEGCSFLEYALIVSNDHCVASLIKHGAHKNVFLNNFKNYELARVFINNILGENYYDTLKKQLPEYQILSKIVSRYERIASIVN